jgi:superfamily II DNA or RNA helicase
MIELIVNYAKTIVTGNCIPVEILRQPLKYIERLYPTANTRKKMAAMAAANHDFKWSNKPIIVEKYLYDEFDNSFPTGMLDVIVRLLQKHNFAYQIKDLRTLTSPGLNFGPRIGDYVKKIPRPYQSNAIDQIIDKKRGILRIACGGGKTLCAGEAIRTLARRSVFLVNRGGLLYQAKGALNGILGQDIGQIGDGVVDIKDVNVVMLQTLIRHLGKKYEVFDDEDTDEDSTDVNKYRKEIQDMLDGTEVVFLDECHCIGAQTAFDCISAFKNAEWRVGCSATPTREDGKDIYFEACFGPKLVDISFTYLIENGFLVRPYICFNELNGPILGMHTNKRYSTIYKFGIVNNTYRNRLIVMEAKLLAANGHKPMILVQHLPHGHLLKSYLPEAVFIHGEHQVKNRITVLDDFCSGKIPILIATTIMDEAIDIPPCDAVIMGGGGASYARTIQRISRAMRIDPKNPQKKCSIIIDFFDQDKFLQRHSYVRQTTYKSESAFRIVLPHEVRPFDVF